MDTAIVRQKIHEYVDRADDRFLTLVNRMIEADNDQDWWDELSIDEKAAIDEGLDQLNKGQSVSHESVQEEIKQRFNF